MKLILYYTEGMVMPGGAPVGSTDHWSPAQLCPRVFIFEFQNFFYLRFIFR